MRRSVSILMALALLFLLAAPCFAGSAVSVQARCAVLMDAESGRVLYAKEAHTEARIASTTKLLTALVAAEQAADLDIPIAVEPQWTGIEGSSIYLKPGETVSLRLLLYGLLLQSGNDAAVAIANIVAGGEDAFAALMNRRAAELGMADSAFSNASGLDGENHYSTAYDMALLARACLANDTVREICAARTARIGERYFVNHNKLLSRYEGCIGMKTGYTEKAGRTLVSAAQKNGQTLICVTLDDPDDWRDHAALLDYGFAAYPRANLCTQGEAFGSVPVSGSLIPSIAAVASVSAGYPLGAGEALERSVALSADLAAPVRPGLVVGQVRWSLNGTTVVEVPLVSADTALTDVVEPLSFWQRIAAFWQDLF